MDSLLRDLRFGLTLLGRERGFATAALTTLAVCFAANATVFTIVHSVLLRPLPVSDADRLVLMANHFPRAGVVGNISDAADYYDRLRGVTALDEQAMFNIVGTTIEIGGMPQRVEAMTATPSLLRMLKVSPVLGRIFDEDEGTAGNDQKVILSDAAWQELFNRSPGVIGHELRLNGLPCAIIGVLPAGFLFISSDVRVWTPLTFTDQQKSTRPGGNTWHNVGHLRPGATLEQVRSQVKAIDLANLDRYPEWKQATIDTGFYTSVEPLQDLLVRDVKATLYMFWGGAAFVLLIGAVNIANLAMARSSVRMKELAMRLTLGASRPQLFRQLVTENLLVTFLAATIGLIVAMWVLDGLNRMGLQGLPRANEIRIDSTVVLFVMTTAAVVGVLVGIFSIAPTFASHVADVLQNDSRTAVGGIGARTTRRVLVVAQVALALVLLVGAGLLFASFRQILSVDPGFVADDVVTAAVSLPRSKYPDDPTLRAFMTRALDAVRSIPDVASAGATNSVPFDENHLRRFAVPEGYAMRPGESAMGPRILAVTAGYFETMRIPLIRGRYFDDRDTDASTRVVIVDERLARRFWSGRDPIGRRLLPLSTPDDLNAAPDPTQLATVVGVVKDVRLEDLAGDESGIGAFYYVYVQGPGGRLYTTPRTVKLVVRTRTNAEATIRAVRSTIARLDPELALFDARTMSERTDLSITSRRAMLTLAVSFGVVALFLAAVGIYGVLMYLVAQRTREFGIRIALGGTAHHLMTIVAREGLLMVVGGVAIGFVGAVGLRRVIEKQIYGVDPLDPVVIVVGVALLALVALIACMLPARRATRVDPIIVLNQT